MKFPFAAMALMVLAGVCFIIFIVANYALDNPDTGLFTKLNESAGKTMNTGMLTWFQERLDNIRTGFGLSGLILFSLAIVVAVAQSFDKGEYG